ncbi:MAG: hypothetical protein WA047_05065 [Phenylobacterium sp.]|uniref:hypothetical protein n=1 Tax=Phenylobacterium sp. TaxID=1871053 RepID=UPI003BB5E990
MAWRKLGLVYSTPGDQPWALTNAIFPTAELRDPDTLRIYITTLDAQQFGRGSYVDVAADDPTRILRVSERPVLDLGEVGDFDDAGANPFAVIEFRGRKLMYYQGWQRTLRAPYQVFTGLAFEAEDGTFEKWGRVPVLDRTSQEPHMRAAPCLLREGDRLLLWYVSSAHWTQRSDGLHYHVVIRHAVSDDGVNWDVHPDICLAPAGNEYAVGRPWVVRENGLFRMWYSVRSFDQPYRIGYAQSADGIRWERLDHLAGIARSQAGWDSEMICYPNVVRVGARLLMFYNGNHHGASGFGCAEWIDEPPI